MLESFSDSLYKVRRTLASKIMNPQTRSGRSCLQSDMLMQASWSNEHSYWYHRVIANNVIVFSQKKSKSYFFCGLVHCIFEKNCFTMKVPNSNIRVQCLYLPWFHHRHWCTGIRKVNKYLSRNRGAWCASLLVLPRSQSYLRKKKKKEHDLYHCKSTYQRHLRRQFGWRKGQE